MEDGSARGSAVSSVWSWPVTLSVHTGRLCSTGPSWNSH